MFLVAMIIADGSQKKLLTTSPIPTSTSTSVLDVSTATHVTKVGCPGMIEP